jgi:hypothetical protein
MVNGTVQLVARNLEALGAGAGCVNRIQGAETSGFRLETVDAEGPDLLIGDRRVYGGGKTLARAGGEAQAFLNNQRPGLVAFFGFGLGLHLNAIRRLTSAPVVVYEPDAGAAAFVLSRVTVDLPEVYLATTPGAFHDLLCSLQGQKRPQLLAGMIPSYGGHYPEELESFRQVIRKNMENQEVARRTRARFSSEWVDNLASNLPFLAGHKPISCLGDALAGKPAIFLGAGPSLDHNLEELRQAQGKALLVAAHTAVIPLSRAGVVPDLVVIIEGQKLDHYFAGVPDLDRMVLVPSPQTHPIHFTLGFKDCLGVSLEGNAAADWLAQAYGDEPLPSGGSVACASFQVMKFLGCDPLVCVGMDFALSHGRSHAAGTEHGCCRMETDVESGITRKCCTEGNHREKQLPTTMVPAWGGEASVPTQAHLSSFRYWFEEAARSSLQGTRLINANGAGAHIRGFVDLGMDEVLNRYCTEPQGLSATLDEALVKAEVRPSAPLVAAVRQELEAVMSAGEAALRAGEAAGKALRCLKSGRRDQVQRNLDRLRSREQLMAEHTRKTRLLNTLVGHRAESIAKDSPGGDKVARTIASLERGIEISRVVAEGAEELLGKFRPALESLDGR